MEDWRLIEGEESLPPVGEKARVTWPGNNTVVLATIDGAVGIAVAMATIDGLWFIPGRGHHVIPSSAVTAWMPLPKPYDPEAKRATVDKPLANLCLEAIDSLLDVVCDLQHYQCSICAREDYEGPHSPDCPVGLALSRLREVVTEEAGDETLRL